MKLGSSQYRLKIWNKGKAAARNVRIGFPDGNDIVPEHELSEKFPMEVLEQYQSIELLAVVGMSTRRKQTVRLEWEDDASNDNEKIVYPTI